ncbi:helix-turn-helix domain-containing protein [Granulicella paludicola]|uniref:helix-turn-helix domain-containing protein n=1 Tax=Granulicella paludicola TaxID=474951 RepID=UPI0037C19DE7
MAACTQPLAERYKNILTESIDSATEFSRFLSQKEAADLRGVSKQAIAALVKRGRLSTVTIAGHKLVLRSEVEEFAALAPGRPPKKKAAKKSAKKQS